MSVGQMSAGQMSAGQTSAGQMSAGQMSIGQLSVGQISLAHMYAGVNLIKLFCMNLLTLICKLDCFITVQQILLMFIKWSCLPKSVSKFMPKKFY
jgi:hypothetical protein